MTSNSRSSPGRAGSPLHAFAFYNSPEWRARGARPNWSDLRRYQSPASVCRLVAIALWKFLVPFPGALNNGIKRLEFWFPAKLPFDFVGRSD